METKTIVRISEVRDTCELFAHYDRQTEPQSCYIELDCQTGLLSASYNAEIGNAVPFSVYHGHDRRYSIPCLVADAANALMSEIAPLAQRVLDGYSSHWDGNNHVARLDDDASKADEAIEAMCDNLDPADGETVVGCDASEWLYGWDRLDEITAGTTDEQIDAMESEITAETDENIYLRGVGQFLRDKRQEAIDAAD